MRSIPAALAEKVRQLEQTRGNDSDPGLSVIVSRHRIPITDYAMFQTVEISAADAVRAAVAARRPNPRSRADKIYIGVVKSGAQPVEICSADFDGYRPPTVWNVETTINDAVDVALAFEGKFSQVGRRVEFFTTGAPWVFWIDSNGDLRSKRLTESGQGTVLAGNAVAVSAMMGPAGYGGSVSAGLVLAWVTTTGAVLTCQYADGIWESGVLCSAAPEGVVDLALSRTWDYRVAMSLQTDDGKAWLMCSRSMVSGNANNAYIDVPAMTIKADILHTIDSNTREDEHLQVAIMDLTAGIYDTAVPALISVENIDDGAGNWGVKLRLTYSGPVYGLAGNGPAFSLSGGGTFVGEALAYDPADPDLRTVILTVTDFNNASSECTLTYIQGTLATGPEVTLLPDHWMEFTATNLVPSAPPVLLSIVAVNNTTIDVQFDQGLSSTDIGANAAAFTITGNEPAYSPGGASMPTTYVLSSVAFKDGTTDTVRLTFTYAGRLRHPQGNVTVAYMATSGNLKNGAGTLAVSTFSQAFDPDEAVLVLFFNPHAPENIQVSMDMTVDVGKVTYIDGKTGDEQIQVSDMDLTVAVYDTSSNPV